MFHTVRRFSQLSTPARRALVAASALLVVVRFSLVMSTFARVRRLLTCLGRRRWGLFDDATASVDRVAWAVSVAGRRLPGASPCLPRALVAHTMLRTGGHDPTLHIGVAKSEATVEAHSWVTVAGDVVVGDLSDLDRFETLDPVSQW